MPKLVKSFWSFTGKVASIRNCDYRDDGAGRIGTQTSKDIVDAVRTLARICPDDLLANVLNRNGLLTGRGNRWTRERVVSLRTHHDIACYDRDRRTSEGWLNLNEAARVLGISPRTLRLAVERGEIDAVHVQRPPRSWLVYANEISQ